jgi:hypothetical protein
MIIMHAWFDGNRVTTSNAGLDGKRVTMNEWWQ